MKVIDGKAVYERVQCWRCDGKGEMTLGVSCPAWLRPVKNLPGSKCPHCGAKNRHDHKMIGTELMKCDKCKGVGTLMENKFDSSLMWKELPMTVRRSTREQQPIEAYFGVGICSVTDYGRHEKMTDEELIAHVKESQYSSAQYLNFVTDSGKVADRIVIDCNDMGYNIVPEWWAA